MAAGAGWYAGELRRGLTARDRVWARGRGSVEGYGWGAVVVYPPDDHPTDEDLSAETPVKISRHGNFFDDSYAAIVANKEWMRRFEKIHAQGRALPKAERKWRELDSSMSSDALLMNVFLGFESSEVGRLKDALGVEGDGLPEFGWR